MKRFHVFRDSHAIQLDGAEQSIEGNGHQAKLPGGTDHQDIGENRVAHQATGEPVGVEQRHVLLADDVADCANAFLRA